MLIQKKIRAGLSSLAPFLASIIVLTPLLSACADGGATPAINDDEKAMRVTLLGVGTRYHLQDEGGSSVLVVVDGEPLLFDVGPVSMQRLPKAGVNPRDVEHVFITHLHMDHISAVPEFLSLNFLLRGKTHIYGPDRVENMVEGAKQFLGYDFSYFGRPVEVPVTTIKEGGVVLETETFTVSAAPTAHLPLEGPNKGHSFAYRVDSAYGSVVISGDTVPSLNVVDLAKGADLLIHEVMPDPPESYGKEFWNSLTDAQRSILEKGPDKLSDGIRTGPAGWTAHSAASEVGEVATAAEVDKLVLYHRPVFAATAEEMKRATDVWGMREEHVTYSEKSRLIQSVTNRFDGPVFYGEPMMSFVIGDRDAAQ